MTTFVAAAEPADAAPIPPVTAPRRPLDAYRDEQGRTREVVARPGARGSVLVIDEDAATLGDGRLVAHLAADEPARNAELVARLYIADPDGRRARPVLDEDWRRAPGAPSSRTPPPEQPGPGPDVLFDADGRSYRLAVLSDHADGTQLRWTCTSPDGRITRKGLREVVGALEAYEPACALTEAALRQPSDSGVCTLALAGQLQRLRRSPTVLNRRLREAVQDAVRDGLTLSQIAARCGRRKCRRTGARIGDTSWLGRRVGLLPEAGQSEPSAWVHVDVLAAIARDGLGLDPRDVEPT